MLNIGKKVYRNLPEQVAYNTECIKKLDEALDGLVIEDHLVVVGDISGTISEEDLAILRGNLAFMYYDGAVYIKTVETLTELVFKKCEIYAEEVGSAYFKIGMQKIEVTISSRAYTISNEDVINIYSKSQIDSIVSNIMAIKVGFSDLLDKTYPVGAIYMSVVSTSPASIFGGTWQALESRFLLGAGTGYTAGDTGGEATHTLTLEEMPQHEHNVCDANGVKVGNTQGTGNALSLVNTGYNNPSGSTNYLRTGKEGSGQAHNNMPPYLVVYMWKRTA